jgi:hypothetical protein
VRVLDASGAERWRDDFGKCPTTLNVHKSSLPTNATAPRPGAAVNWNYPTAPPYLADGGKRDRLVWSGDLWWSQRTAYCAFGPDDPHLPGALRILAFNQTPEGLVHAAPYAHGDAPPRSGDYGLFASDEFSAWFVPVLWPAADRDLRYLATRMGADGLHEPRMETSKHAYAMECGDLSRRVYQNLVFWMSWRDGARLARSLGLTARAAELEALAAAHGAAIRKAFCAPAETPESPWNTEIGKTGADPLSCAMLLASGFLDDAEAAAVVAERKRAGDDYGIGKFRALALRGMFRHGFVADAMRLVRGGGWAALADPSWPGAHCTTECLYRYSVGWWDESHPDTSLSDVFQTFLLGVEPLEPGFRTFRVAPRVPDGIDHARGAIPTPHGPIHVQWHRDPAAPGGAPAGIRLAFTVPGGTRAVLPDGRAFGPSEAPRECILPASSPPSH